MRGGDLGVEVEFEPSVCVCHRAGVEHDPAATGEVLPARVIVMVDRSFAEIGDQRAVRVAHKPDRRPLASEVVGGVRGAGDPAGDRVRCASVSERDLVAARVGWEPDEPRELLGRELSVLPVKFGALTWQRQHVEREVPGDPAVVVAGEYERAALAHEIDDRHRVGGAEADDVAQAPDLIHARAVDRGENAPERRKVAVDVCDHGDAHRGSGCVGSSLRSWIAPGPYVTRRAGDPLVAVSPVRVVGRRCGPARRLRCLRAGCDQ